ncbi:MAG: hypothetical protein WC831_02330 [Parcubacteria group bacterium]|jgi:hypothetical protein
MKSVKKLKLIFALALVAAFLFQASGIGSKTALAKKTNESRLVLIGAAITGIEDTVITARSKSGKNYQIETQGVKILRRNAGKCDFSEMAAGDKISVWGTENGMNITAKKIKDISVERVRMEGVIFDIDEDNNTISFYANGEGIQTVEIGDATKITFQKVRKSNFPNLKATVFGIRNKTQNMIYGTTKIIVYSE